MKRLLCWSFAGIALLTVIPALAQAEILAMVNYETKPGQTFRKEGIAIIDVDPNSPNFGKILVDMPLPHDLHNHHIFYNRDASKAYMTVFGQNALYVMDLKRFPYRTNVVSVPDCEVGEDIIFSGDNSKWYLACMGSNTVIIGDAVSDKPLKTVHTPKPYPHGIAIHEGIDRILITGTIKHDLTDPGETITVIEASTGKPLNSHKVSNKPSPSGEAPVEILFMPGTNPPIAYITNMFGASLWAAVWNPAKKDFDVHQAVDLKPYNGGVPLEMYFNPKGDRLYLTTANPGQFHIFDVGKDPKQPKLLKSIPAAPGAHHVAFTKDGRYAFVQNNLLSLPSMSDGSITVIDLKEEKVVKSIDTFKDQGLNPNLIVLLPEWNDPAGH
ncbi:MAG: YncE family protein [Deltaproteobacteria bacterium]|nr:YncE family protein [Deltaproteobacteria bacterium]